MPDPLIGRTVAGRFEVRRVLGHGGMGAVYEAVQQPVGRRVALKVLKGSLRSSDRLQRRFLREAQAIAQLNHPNIITLYDFGVDEGLTFIAMEYVDGTSLFDVIEEPLDIQFIVHVMTHVIDALIEAHSHGIIHRDLKPENIMLTSLGGNDNSAKVLDFGLARLAESKSDVALTAAGEVFGTPLYMSPEQANGEEVTAASDLYAIGCILFQMVTGDPPFFSERPMTLLMMHTNDPIPDIYPQAGVNVSEQFCDVITTCLAKEPEDRYPSAAALLDAIGGTPEGVYVVDAKTSGRVDSLIDMHRPNLSGRMSIPPRLDTESFPPAPAHTTPPVPEKKPPLFLMMGVGFAVALVVVGLFLALRDEPAPAAKAVPEPFAPYESVELSPRDPYTLAREITHRAVNRAVDRNVFHAVSSAIGTALSQPERDPDRNLKNKPKKGSRSPWGNVIGRRHERRVSTRSYPNPVTLLFGG